MQCRQLVVLLGLISTPLAAQQRTTAVTSFETEGSVGLAAEEYDALSRALGALLVSELGARRTAPVISLPALPGGRPGRVDLAQARDRGVKAGAALLVVGTLLDEYGDVHVEARVVDAATGAPVAVVRGDARLVTRDQLGEAVADLAHRLAMEVTVGGAPEPRWRRTLASKALILFGRGLRLEAAGDRTQAVAAYRAALAAAPTLTEAKNGLSRVGG